MFSTEPAVGMKREQEFLTALSPLLRLHARDHSRTNTVRKSRDEPRFGGVEGVRTVKLLLVFGRSLAIFGLVDACMWYVRSTLLMHVCGTEISCRILRAPCLCHLFFMVGF